MARDVIAPVKLTRELFHNLGTLAAPANGAAFTQANGQKFTPKKGGKMALLVYNSKAGAIVVTVKAGATPAGEVGLGDFVSAGIATVTFTLIVLDVARHLQADGSIYVDTDAGATGSMWAWEMP